MRTTDLDAMATPYDESDPRPGHEQFAGAIGAEIPSVRALDRLITSDIDPQSGAVGWWRGLDVARNALIADQLRQCVMDIDTNVVEARLHVLEAEHALDQVAAFVQTGAAPGKEPPFVPPRMSRPSDSLPYYLADLHIGGAFRALGSAFDCLAASAIGVLGLRLDLKKARFKGTREHLVDLAKSDAPAGRSDELKRLFLEELERLETTAGPPSWLAWLLDYRHTLVHRGRRIRFWHIAIQQSGWFTPTFRPQVRTAASLLLASRPSLSEAEAHSAAQLLDDIALKESAATTLRGAFGSSVQLLKGAAFALALAWCTRRASSSFCEQPTKQWSEAGVPPAFAGWRPGEVTYDPSEIRMNPADVHRISRARFAKPA